MLNGIFTPVQPVRTRRTVFTFEGKFIGILPDEAEADRAFLEGVQEGVGKFSLSPWVSWSRESLRYILPRSLEIQIFSKPIEKRSRSVNKMRRLKIGAKNEE